MAAGGPPAARARSGLAPNSAAQLSGSVGYATAGRPKADLVRPAPRLPWARPHNVRAVMRAVSVPGTLAAGDSTVAGTADRLFGNSSEPVFAGSVAIPTSQIEQSKHGSPGGRL